MKMKVAYEIALDIFLPKTVAQDGTIVQSEGVALGQLKTKKSTSSL